jgi:hypothetical protein
MTDDLGLIGAQFLTVPAVSVHLRVFKPTVYLPFARQPCGGVSAEVRGENGNAVFRVSRLGRSSSRPFYGIRVSGMAWSVAGQLGTRPRYGALPAREDGL